VEELIAGTKGQHRGKQAAPASPLGPEKIAWPFLAQSKRKPTVCETEQRIAGPCEAPLEARDKQDKLKPGLYKNEEHTGMEIAAAREHPQRFCFELKPYS